MNIGFAPFLKLRATEKQVQRERNGVVQRAKRNGPKAVFCAVM